MAADRVLPDLTSFDIAAEIDAGSGVVPPENALDADRFLRAIGLIDKANALDPNTVRIGVRDLPKELTHAVMATSWVRYFDPAADEAQLLAARAHHLRRWTLPRDDFAEGRAGYLRWRAMLKKQHARETAEILTAVGYHQDLSARVQSIVRKEGLGRDASVQIHEDALCLVFIQTQLPALSDQLGDDHVVAVVAKTIRKMSERALEAVGLLELDDRRVSIIGRALAAIPTPSSS